MFFIEYLDILLIFIGKLAIIILSFDKDGTQLWRGRFHLFSFLGFLIRYLNYNLSDYNPKDCKEEKVQNKKRTTRFCGAKSNTLIF